MFSLPHSDAWDEGRPPDVLERLEPEREDATAEDRDSDEDLFALTRSRAQDKGRPPDPDEVDWPDRYAEADIGALQAADPELGHLLRWKRLSNERPDWLEVRPLSREVKSLWQQWDRLLLKGELLFRRCVVPWQTSPVH